MPKKPSYTPEHARSGLSARFPQIETWPNQFPGYEIVIDAPEFTSVCPKTGLPDFGTITLRYMPDRRCLELKSFKEYLLAYRELGIFQENVVNRVLEDVVRAARPVWAVVRGEFRARGGIGTVVEARWPRPDARESSAGPALRSTTQEGEMNDLLRFVLHHIEDEWDRLLHEFVQLSPEAFTWQPDPKLHSAGWHVRHVIEWRYALVHMWIGGQPNEEKLYCLGWENDPTIRKLVANPGEWYEPRCTVQETVQFADRIRTLTNQEIAELPPGRFSEEIVFPWRPNRVLDEIFEETRHSALHRGHVRELKKLYSRRTQS